MNRYSSCAAWAAAVSLAGTVGAVVTILHPRVWLTPSPAWSGLAPVALLYSTGLLIAAAPVAGVAIGCRERLRAKVAGAASTAARIVVSLVVGALAFAAAAAASTLTIGLFAGEDFSMALLGAHAVQGIAALAIGLGGAVLACWFRNPLDAAAWAVTLTWVGSFGILGAGTLVERLPHALVEWTLGASPLMVVATAARIDVLRTDIVYQISPLAHAQMQLPDWPIVSAGYLSLAAACAVVLLRVSSEATPASQQHILEKDFA